MAQSDRPAVASETAVCWKGKAAGICGIQSAQAI